MPAFYLAIFIKLTAANDQLNRDNHRHFMDIYTVVYFWRFERFIVKSRQASSRYQPN